MKAVRVGIVGYGTVGQGAARIIASHAHDVHKRNDVCLTVSKVCRRTPIPSSDLPPGAQVVSDWKQVVHADDVDIVVETIGGTTVADQVVRASLESGKPVVTANKNLIAENGEKLFALAAQKNLPIGMEATVAGGIPILRVLSESMSGDRVQSVYGILNGTANYILTQMESTGARFDQALTEAQKGGYAEADPTFDIDGIDARDKLCILARLAFHARVSPADIATIGIRQISDVDMHYARRLRSKIRLVAMAERNHDGLDLSVRPWLVEDHSMLAKVEGVNNAVFLQGERVGTQMFLGRGAGGDPTGAAVVSDLIEIGGDMVAGRIATKALSGFTSWTDATLHAGRRAVSWYLRLTVSDRPGIIARVAEVLAEKEINIDSVFQEPHMSKERLSFVITVEPVLKATIQAAVKVINQFDFMKEPVLLLRISNSA
ncbi:MAG TPA: homoserine dehydrogenase [Terriglobales bacterium]